MTAKNKSLNLKSLDPTVVSEVFTRRVAVLAMSGMSAAQIAEDTGLAPTAIKSIQETDIYKKYVTRAGEQEMQVALMRAKARLAAQVDTAGEVYEKVMRDYLDGKSGARDAVVVAQSVHRAVGVDNDNAVQGDQTLIVNMPNGITSTISVKPEKVEDV